MKELTSNKTSYQVDGVVYNALYYDENKTCIANGDDENWNHYILVGSNPDKEFLLNEIERKIKESNNFSNIRELITLMPLCSLLRTGILDDTFVVE